MLLATCAPQTLTLVDDGQSPYQIVLHYEPEADAVRAAEVLQYYIREISGAEIPIVSSDEPPLETEIVLGSNPRFFDLETNLNLDSLRTDGYAIRTVGRRLVIVGGYGQGTLYGVYAFLEKHLGLRKYSSTVKVVPKSPRIRVGYIDEMEIPVNDFRDTHYRDTNDPEYTEWHALDHDASGGHPDWGLWVHTFNHLVPPETYYKSHPEYYALVDGRRVPTQLCLTNENVLRVLIENLGKEMDARPEARYWSVSQNDNTQHCQCDRCRAIDEAEQSPAGTLMRFVNQVAAAFPSKVISTLAYQYTRKPPILTEPARNVNIMLCSIEANRSLSLAEDSTSADFRADLEGWSRIASNILMWDYVVQFRNLVSPFPNLHVLQPNLQYFASQGVTAHFQQGNREIGGEFAELRAYLISKLLWNPNRDLEAVMDDFLNGFYGEAAGPIRTYIDESREALLASGERLDIFGNPNQHQTGYLSPERMARYSALFDEAEKAVADDPEVLLRVRQARLPVEYALLEQSKKRFLGEQGLFVRSGDAWREAAGIRDRLNRFVDLCVATGVTRLKEWSTPPDAYRTAFLQALDRGLAPSLAFEKPVRFVTQPDSLGGLPSDSTLLTDGKRGVDDWTYNWAGWQGRHMVVVIDLGEPKVIRRISSGYFQWNLDWIFLPTRVDYSLSDDGLSFLPVASVAGEVPPDSSGVIVEDFAASFDPETARYVRVEARSILTCPPWHHGAGGKAWLLADEVIVE